MSKTTSIYARVEPQVKEQAELVLSQLGIPMSNAINIFLRQVVLQNGLPFEVKLDLQAPLIYEDLSTEQFDAEIEKSFKSLQEGKVVSADLVAERMKKLYRDEL